MTAQHDVQSGTDLRATAPEHTDPLGPITLPERGKIGARALALAGTVGVSAAAVAAASEITWPTISAY